MHFTVTVIGEDPAKELAPFQENNDGDCPKELLEFHDEEPEYRERWEENEANLSEYYPSNLPVTENDVKKVRKAEDKFKGMVLHLPQRYMAPAKGQYYQLYVRPAGDQRSIDGKETNIYIKVTKCEKKKGNLQNVLTISAEKVAPPRKMRPQEKFKTFEEFMEDNCTEKDEETGKYGYWHNPNAKWDWYQIGGRWTGSLKLKKGAIGNRGEEGTFARMARARGEDLPRAPEDRCDQARMKDIDWEGMAEDRIRRATEEWGTFMRITENAESSGKKGKELSIEIRNGLYDARISPFAEFTTLEEHIKNAAEDHTFAILYKGKWDEEGWHSKEGSKEEEAWEKRYQETMSKVGPDELVTIVDCHT